MLYFVTHNVQCKCQYFSERVQGLVMFGYFAHIQETQHIQRRNDAGHLIYMTASNAIVSLPIFIIKGQLLFFCYQHFSLYSNSINSFTRITYSDNIHTTVRVYSVRISILMSFLISNLLLHFYKYAKGFTCFPQSYTRLNVRRYLILKYYVIRHIWNDEKTNIYVKNYIQILVES